MHQPDRTKKLRFNSNSSAKDYTRPGHRQPEDTYHQPAPPARTKSRKATNPPTTADTTPPTPPLPDQEIRPPTPGRTLMTKRSNSSQTSAPPGRPPQTNHTSLQPPRTFESIIANFPPAAQLHPVTADNGAIMARHPFAQRPAPYPRPINHDSNPPDNDCDSDGPPSLIPDSDDSGSDDDNDGAFAHNRDDDCRSSSGTTQGIATSPSNFRTLPSQTWCQIMAGN